MILTNPTRTSTVDGPPTSASTATAVALFLYKRPHLASTVLASIRSARPTKLFLIADGPSCAQDLEACGASRRLAAEVDWDCEIWKNYSDIHLGCCERISSGISWVFEHVDQAIFLEDDCVADGSFFPFCEELLSLYKHDTRVMAVTGFNLLDQSEPNEQSYVFSRYSSSWGWATWRNAWRYFDASMSAWADSDIRDHIRHVLGDDDQFEERTKLIEKVLSGSLDSWAIPWSLACLMRGGLCAVPTVNLISNIGFGQGATHFHNPDDPNAGIPRSSISFPLRGPLVVEADRNYDRQWHRKACGQTA